MKKLNKDYYQQTKNKLYHTKVYKDEKDGSALVNIVVSPKTPENLAIATAKHGNNIPQKKFFFRNKNRG